MLRIEYQSNVSLAPDDLGLLDVIRECDALDREDVVTGFLHYDGRQFHHVIEGPSHVLTPFFEELRWNPRHYKVQVSDCSQINARAHNGFTFKYVDEIGEPLITVGQAQVVRLVTNEVLGCKVPA